MYEIPKVTVSYSSAGNPVVSVISRDLSWNFQSVSPSGECPTLPPSSQVDMGVLGDVEGVGVDVVGVKKGRFQVENQPNVLSVA